MFRIFKKVWLPLLLVVVIALGAYAVVRIHDLFGVNPVAVAGDENGDRTAAFNPKHITYEITGSPGGHADVDYLDQDGQPHRIDAAHDISYILAASQQRALTSGSRCCIRA